MTRPLDSRAGSGQVVKLEERQLLVRHRDGEPGAFAELVARYRAPVYGYLVRLGVDAEARDDLFQEIFIKIHNAASRYRADRPLHPWVFTIVANTVRSHLRKKRVQQLVFSEKPREEIACDNPDGYQLIEAKETVSWLALALQRLPAAQREVLILCCIENLPQHEVAEILGIPVNTVKTNLRRGRMALARALIRRNLKRETPS